MFVYTVHFSVPSSIDVVDVVENIFPFLATDLYLPFFLSTQLLSFERPSILLAVSFLSLHKLGH